MQADDELSSVSLMTLSSVDQVAVVKLSDGSMHSLNIGATIPGTRAVLQEVLSDKLVLADTIIQKDRPSLRQMVWLYKAVAGKSRVQRLDQIGPDPVVIQKSMLVEINPDGSVSQHSQNLSK